MLKNIVASEAAIGPINTLDKEIVNCHDLALPIRYVWAGELIRHSNRQSHQSRDTATFLEVCMARWVGAWA